MAVESELDCEIVLGQGWVLLIGCGDFHGVFVSLEGADRSNLCASNWEGQDVVLTVLG